MTYALEPNTARRRALAGAGAGAIAAVGPVVFGLIVLLGTGVEVDSRIVTVVLVVLGALALLRTHLAYSRMHAELVALRVTVDETGIDVRTRKGTHRIPREAIASILEYPGSLGGVRLDLAEKWDGTDRSPAYFDIPRGGEGFGELRTALERWRPVEAPKRRGRLVRIALGVAIVLGLFFVPFLIADLGKTPMLAGAVVLLGYLAMRLALSRR